MMQEVFEKLRNLQDVLSEKYEIEREIEEIPKALTTKNELLNRLKKQYIEKNNRMEEIKEKITSLRIQLSDAERTREGYEKQMDLIKTQREYEALDKEIRDSTEREQQARKDILREEKELEELSISLEREEKLIALQEQELADEQRKIEEESDQKREQLKALGKEEKKIVPGLDEEILFKFERIIRSKSGVGIVPVRNSVCTGCHMVLPPQFENDVRAGERIHFCPYCSRILYFDQEAAEEPEQDSGFIGDEEAGGLAEFASDFEEEFDADFGSDSK